MSEIAIPSRSSDATKSEAERPPDFWPQFLLFSGWAIVLLYFPSGLLHHYLGGAVYGRDLLMGTHFAASTIFLYNNGLFTRLMRHVVWLAVLPLFLLPAVANADYRIEALTLVKWVILWVDCMMVGMLIALARPARLPLKIFCGITLALISADALCGLYEYQHRKFIFQMWGEKSALGVDMGSDQILGGKPRLKGLQRDVFSFANLMAAAAVAGMVVTAASKNLGMRVAGGIGVVAFSAMLFISGGRSAFMGVAAALVGTVAFCWGPELARRYSRRAMAVWLAIGLGISLFGIGSLTQSVSDLLFKGNRVGDARSAYMRDANWDGITSAIKKMPVVLLSGAPVASLADRKIAPIYHWADNEYLWILYHTGIPGALAVFFFFCQISQIESSRPTAVMAFTLFLFFVMGEAIARESLTFLGSLPLFVAIGVIIAPQSSRRRSSRVRKSRPSYHA